MAVFVLYDVCCLLWVLLCVAMNYDAIINGWDMIHDFIFCLSLLGNVIVPLAGETAETAEKAKTEGGKAKKPRVPVSICFFQIGLDAQIVEVGFDFTFAPQCPCIPGTYHFHDNCVSPVLVYEPGKVLIPCSSLCDCIPEAPFVLYHDSRGVNYDQKRVPDMLSTM